jgi:two-component system phosphate regulon response regulator PhoB
MKMTATEYKVMMLFEAKTGQVVTRPEMLLCVWEAAPDITTRTVDMTVSRIRRKLGNKGRILSVRGIGYLYQAK